MNHRLMQNVFELKYLSLIVCAGAMLFATACKEEKESNAGSMGGGQKPAGPPPVFDAVVAGSFAIDRIVSAPGTILPNENTELQSEISGRVVAINFKEGSNVAKGTLLVKLFDGDLQAQLKKLEVQLKVAEATERRQKELLAINGTSQQDYDLATLNVSNIKADMELLRVNISKTEIRAPFDGRLGLRNISLGAYISPATIITNIAQVNTVKVEFAVPEKYAAEMQPGKSVRLSSLSSNTNYTATILAAQNSIAAETRNLIVRAVVNGGKSLSPGSFVEVGIDVGNRQPAIMVPTQSVIPSTRNKSVIVSENGKAVFRVVETGYRDSARIEILSGISSGDTVITNGLLTIKPGMPLKTRVKQ